MREFIEEAYEHRQDGVGRVQAADKAPLMKRFYKAVTIEPAGDQFAILLDGKNMKTPSGKPSPSGSATSASDRTSPAELPYSIASPSVSGRMRVDSGPTS